MFKTQAKMRLEYLRKEIQAERISTGEIAELQSLAKYIDPSDTLLLEWAGVPEHEPQRPCHACGEETVNKYCENTTCEVYIRDEA